MTTLCHKNRRALDAWLTLPPAERATVRAHAVDCTACQPRLERTLAAIEGLEAGREAYEGQRYVGPRPDFSTVVKAPRAGWSWPVWRPLPVALATIFLSLSMVLFVARNEPSRPVTDPSVERTVPDSRTEPDRRTEPAIGGNSTPTGAPGNEAEASQQADGMAEPVAVEPAVVEPSAAIPAANVEPPALPTPNEPGAPPGSSPPAIRPASPSAALGAIRRRAQSLDRSALATRPPGFRFRLPQRPATPRRPTVDGPERQDPGPTP